MITTDKLEKLGFEEKSSTHRKAYIYKINGRLKIIYSEKLKSFDMIVYSDAILQSSSE